MLRPEDWQGLSYSNFVLGNATVAASPIQIDYVRFPLGHRARESPTSGTALTAASLQSRHFKFQVNISQ